MHLPKIFTDFITFLLAGWMRSLRVHWNQPLPRQAIYTLWHRDLPACMAAFHDQGISVLISQSSDGEIAAGTASRLGYQVQRGSSTHGQTALRHLLTALHSGQSVGMALDGPRGPAGQPKPGAVWLAKRTGLPLILLNVKTGPSFRLKTWDRTIFPIPGSSARISLVFQSPAASCTSTTL